jgi:hypothetical protein
LVDINAVRRGEGGGLMVVDDTPQDAMGNIVVVDAITERPPGEEDVCLMSSNIIKRMTKMEVGEEKMGGI